MKEYDKTLKRELAAIITPIYYALTEKNSNIYLLFHYDRRLLTSEKMTK